MSRLARLIALALAVSAGSVSARATIDCGKAYKEFWQGLERKRFAMLPAEQLAGISRMALDAYDACQAGDEHEAKSLFARIALRDNHPDHSTGPFNPNPPDR